MIFAYCLVKFRHKKHSCFGCKYRILLPQTLLENVLMPCQKYPVVSQSLPLNPDITFKSKTLKNTYLKSILNLYKHKNLIDLCFGELYNILFVYWLRLRTYSQNHL